MLYPRVCLVVGTNTSQAETWQSGKKGRQGFQSWALDFSLPSGDGATKRLVAWQPDLPSVPPFPLHQSLSAPRSRPEQPVAPAQGKPVSPALSPPSLLGLEQR